MHRCWVLLPLWLLLTPPTAVAQSTLPVTIARFAGLPADSSDRMVFMESFRAAMDADLPCELHKGDTWSSSGPRRNSFRLVDMAAPDQAWTLELSLGIPPTVRVARATPRGSHTPTRPRMSDMRASRAPNLPLCGSMLAKGIATSACLCASSAISSLVIFFFCLRESTVKTTNAIFSLR